VSDALIALIVLINFAYLLSAGITNPSFEENQIMFIPVWLRIWKRKLPINLAGKIIICILVAIPFLLSDIFMFMLVVLIKLGINIGYAFWWIFAIDRTDVAHRWKCFQNSKKDYFRQIKK
jgi:hypothetical protein